MDPELPEEQSQEWEDGYRPDAASVPAPPPAPRFPWFSEAVAEMMEALAANPWEAALLSVFVSVVLVAIPFVSAFVWQSHVAARPIPINHFADGHGTALTVVFPLLQGFLTGFLTSRRPLGAVRYASVFLVIFALDIAGIVVCGDEPATQILAGLPALILIPCITISLWLGMMAGSNLLPSRFKN